jgi:hypothetical protein
MALTVTLVENKDVARNRMDRDQRGHVITRYYLVEGTRDDVEACNAVAEGVPAIGEAYGAAAPRATVDRKSGEVYAANAVLVTVIYADPERRPSSNDAPPPEGPDSNFTELEFSPSSVGVEWGWDATTDPPDDGSVPTIGPMENVQRIFSTISAKVTVYVAEADVEAVLDIADELASIGALNDDVITLPPLKGTAIERSYNAGKALFAGVAGPRAITTEDGTVYFELVYSLEIRDSWEQLVLYNDDEGEPNAAALAHVQPWRPFDGLWP